MTVPSGHTGAELTRDAFLGGRIEALQPSDGPRSGMDAIFLAAAVPVTEGKDARVLEAGAGAGVASLAIAARAPAAGITAVEIQPGLAALARRNAQSNGFGGRFHVIEADVTAPGRAWASAGLRSESYGHVAANPPFHDPASSRAPADGARARAHQAGPGELRDWLRFCAAMAAPGGSLTLIHRPDVLDGLLEAIGGRFGALVLFPLFPFEGKPATRLLIRGIKGSRAPLSMRRGLVLHGPDGSFTPGAEAVLRSGEALDLEG
ncbi:MAG: tRNA1(Val) (adenine(37)-N6)-methyltransferase [Hyphomicrobiales bacterium]